MKKAIGNPRRRTISFGPLFRGSGRTFAITPRVGTANTSAPHTMVMITVITGNELSETH